MSTEYLTDDDPDYAMIVNYKAAHQINRDCNTADVVVLMRRARAAENERCAQFVFETLMDAQSTYRTGVAQRMAAALRASLSHLKTIEVK